MIYRANEVEELQHSPHDWRYDPDLLLLFYKGSWEIVYTEPVLALYDWRADPLEQKDLAVELPEKADELRSRLIETYRDLLTAAEGMSEPQPVDLAPKRIEELRSLGYIR